MVTPQRGGASSLGCLFTLLCIAAVLYFGVGVGEHYFRFYQYQDSMRQEVKFAAHNSDALILRHLRERGEVGEHAVYGHLRGAHQCAKIRS